MVKKYEVPRLREFVINILKNYGASQEHAEITSDCLIKAELRGVETHGLNRLPALLKKIENNTIELNKDIKIEKEDISTGVIDAQNILGQVSAKKSMDLSTDKARNSGIGMTVVKRSNHIGTAAYYSMLALKKGCIGFTLTNSSPRLPPWGGISKVLGNNPFSIAIPAKNSPPIVLDLSLSVTSAGKIRTAYQKGETIPYGWAFNSEGEVTTDPLQALNGLLAPVGAHKGYGLSLAIEVLAGLLASRVKEDVKSMYDYTQNQNVGHIFLAININFFNTYEKFTELVDEKIEEIKSSQKANWCSEILIPGERGHYKELERRNNGIPVEENTLQELNQIAEHLGIEKI